MKNHLITKRRNLIRRLNKVMRKRDQSNAAQEIAILKAQLYELEQEIANSENCEPVTELANNDTYELTVNSRREYLITMHGIPVMPVYTSAETIAISIFENFVAKEAIV